jgi:5-(carboxyamino)imidazole ribonucleotide mutase
VAINNAVNAALLAVRILSTCDKSLTEKLLAYAEGQKNEVMGKAENLDIVGWEAY